MTYQIVGITEQTRGDFEDVDRIVWFDEPTAPDWPLSGGIETDRAFAATPTGAPPFAGIYAHYDLRLTLTGPDGPRQVPVPGLTWVGVHPDHRRRGVLSAMLDHHLHALHEQGVALSALHASEASIYGRFGYGVASLLGRCEIGSGATLSADGVDDSGITTSTWPVQATEGMVERLVAAHRRIAALTPGQVELPEVLVRRSLHDHPMSLRGTEPYHVLIAERDGQDVGFARLRRTQRWEQGSPNGTLEVGWMQAADPAAELALLRRLTAYDLIGTVQLTLPAVDSPIVWWAGGPRAVRPEQADALWLRLVDVRAALALRWYAAPARLVLEVTDERCPWNARRWMLDVADSGVAQCNPTDAPADLHLSAGALAQAYLGGRRVAEMARQGLVQERTPGSVRALDRAMITDRAPATAVSF